MQFEDLTPELMEKAKECKTTEELFALAKQEGIELSDEELEQVAGGALPPFCSEVQYIWDDCKQVHHNSWSGLDCRSNETKPGD